MKTIKKKIHKEFFGPVCRSEKTFEIRKNDTDYKIGDTLELYEAKPVGRDKNGALVYHVTGWCVRCAIRYLLTGTEWGIQKGFVIIGMGPPSEPIFKPEVVL